MNDSIYAIIGQVTEAERALLANPSTVLFKDLKALCEKYFGECRIKGSHHIFKMPWPGDPRINLQKDGKQAKPYQVKQVIKALEKLQEAKDGAKK
jgi:predicted RNA binding protein YcfA (HicA-like mRNA interferase family)